MKSGRSRGPGKAFKNVGGEAPPTFLRVFPGPRGRPDLKDAPHKSGKTAFRYPVKVPNEQQSLSQIGTGVGFATCAADSLEGLSKACTERLAAVATGNGGKIPF